MLYKIKIQLHVLSVRNDTPGTDFQVINPVTNVAEWQLVVFLNDLNRIARLTAF
jgi:hypothetical protein